jgi:hypothetical protein
MPITKRVSNTPAMDKLEPKDRVFLKHYLQTGNKTQSMLQARPDLKYGSAATIQGRLLKRVQVQDAMFEALDSAGLSGDKIAKSIANLFDCKYDKEQIRSVNNGLIHARAILGLDAPREQHIQVDKREIRITATASLHQLDDLIALSRDSLPSEASPVVDTTSVTSAPSEGGEELLASPLLVAQPLSTSPNIEECSSESLEKNIKG